MKPWLLLFLKSEANKGALLCGGLDVAIVKGTLKVGKSRVLLVDKATIWLERVDANNFPSLYSRTCIFLF